MENLKLLLSGFNGNIFLVNSVILKDPVDIEVCCELYCLYYKAFFYVCVQVLTFVYSLDYTILAVTGQPSAFL